MPFIYNNKQVNTIQYKDGTRKRPAFKDVRVLKYKENASSDAIVVWMKSYELIYSYNDFLLKSVVINRIFSANPQARLGRIYSQTKIYQGDVLSVSVELLDKYIDTYEIDPYDSQIVVNGDYTHHYSAHIKE